MKRMIRWMSALRLLLLMETGALAELDIDVLMAEPWVNSDGVTLIFNEGGKGQMMSGMTLDTTWTTSDDNVTYTFSFYGEHSYTLRMAQENGVPTLTLDETGTVYMPKTEFDKLAEQKQKENENLYPLKLDEEVNLGFVKMTFTDVEATDKIGGTMFSLRPLEGQQYFGAVGTIENTGKTEIFTQKIRAEIVINGSYTFRADVYFATNEVYMEVLEPMSKAEIYIVASMDESAVKQIENCEVHFALNDQFKTQPMFVADGEYAFSIASDEAAVN